MYQTIIVGYDDSDRAEDALALGRGVSKLTGAQLTLARVLPLETWLHPGARSPIGPPQELLDERLAELRSELEPTAKRSGAKIKVLTSPSAPQGLHQLAGELNADLIVVGSSHRGRVGQVLAGNAGERLFHGSPCAVAVAPRGFTERREQSLGVIGVGYDGSPESEIALTQAVRLSESLRTALKVFAVAPTTPFGKGWNLGTDMVNVAAREHLEESVNAAIARLPEGSLAEGVLLRGHPAEVLAEQHVDLLIVGSRGYGPLRTVLLGGVSGPLVRRASSPILVLPRSATT